MKHERFLVLVRPISMVIRKTTSTMKRTHDAKHRQNPIDGLTNGKLNFGQCG
jgi:hypothetical protein